jgi:hypothetical protein
MEKTDIEKPFLVMAHSNQDGALSSKKQWQQMLYYLRKNNTALVIEMDRQLYENAGRSGQLMSDFVIFPRKRFVILPFFPDSYQETEHCENPSMPSFGFMKVRLVKKTFDMSLSVFR